MNLKLTLPYSIRTGAKMKVTLMGTGTSHGVPVLGCNCPTCLSKDLRDFRTRSSIHVETNGLHIQIDTANEFRLQALKNKIPRVDLVLLTHSHADHITGFDDLRRFNEIQGAPIPVYGNRETIEGIRSTFSYIFNNQVQLGGGKPQVELFEARSTLEFNRVSIIPIEVFHGRIPVLGYRIGNLAYITDCSIIPETSLKLLHGLEILILGVLRIRPHPTHFNLEEGLKAIRQIAPGKCILTHLAHDFKHDQAQTLLPPGVEFGYDGQEIIL